MIQIIYVQDNYIHQVKPEIILLIFILVNINYKVMNNK